MLPDILPRLVSEAWFSKPAPGLDVTELDALENSFQNQLNALVYNLSDKPPIGLSKEDYQAIRGRQSAVEADGEYEPSEDEDIEEEEEDEEETDLEEDLEEEEQEEEDDEDDEMMDEDSDEY